MIPNIITLIRLIGIIVLTIFIDLKGINSIWVFILFVLILITDFLDGYIARKYNMITEFGKSFDQVADKALVVLTTIVLIKKDIMPLSSLFIYIRDIIIFIMAMVYVFKYKKALASNIWGKLKTNFHFYAIALVLLLKEYTVYSSILLVLGLLTLIPEVIFRYKEILREKEV